MSKVIEIKRKEFVKYRKFIYLAKDFEKLDNGKFRLNYFFKSIKKDTAKLYASGFVENSIYQFEYLKKATQEESEFLLSKIRIEHPNFDLSSIKIETNKIRPDLDLDDCIDYLKSKGYLVYKQV